MIQTRNEAVIVGIDHGYGNIKTATTCFPTGVTEYDKEPTFTGNMLEYEGLFYIVGEGHKEFTAEKQADNDFYILTLATVARELYARNLSVAKVHLAAGLPLTWVSEQKEDFKRYLLQKPHADFRFKRRDFHVDFIGADIFPQGFSAVADRLGTMRGINMLCDIGNGTMNVMVIADCRPKEKLCFTEKYGTNQCMLAIREAVMQKHNVTVDDSVIESVLRFDTADIGDKYLATIRLAAEAYTEGIFRRLREHEYNPELMRLFVVGGGGCMIRNFGRYDKSRVTIIDDICATAKGYEYLACRKMQRNGGAV